MVRTICEHCKQPRVLTTAERNYLNLGEDDVQVWEGDGCSECRNTGYHGRIGIFEVMDVNSQIKAALSSDIDLITLAELARQGGMTSLRESAIRKMMLGETTFEEVVAVTG